MDSRNLEHAAEFCKLVGAPDLLAYLGLDADVDAAEARQKLKARRKYMQGMQGNPKYKQEALYLIKHFAALDDVLGDPAAYLTDAQRRAESVHVPILEMSVRSVLAGGSLQVEQEDFLRRNAIEMGISEETFEELLERLAREAGVKRPSAREPTPIPPRRSDPPRPSGVEFYELLGVPPQASADEVREAWGRRRAQVERLPASQQREELLVRLDLAHAVLSDRNAREQYDLASTRTGPPARRRTIRPDHLATAPPIRSRASSPPRPGPPPIRRPARLEVDGDPLRELRVFARPAVEVLSIRNIGDEPMHGTVTADVSWLRVSPARIDPEVKEQRFELVVDPSAMASGTSTGRVKVATDGGDATVEVRVRRLSPALALLTTVAVVGVVPVGLGCLALLLFVLAGPGSSGLTIHVDPAATEVRLDGQLIGHGSVVHVEEPPLGEVTLSVRHPNFHDHASEIVIERGRARTVDVRLELARDMDFRPTEKMARGELDGGKAREVVGARSASIDRCLSAAAEPGQVLTGTLRVHVGPDGNAVGFDVQGQRVDRPDVLQCLAREAAAVTFPPLERGDYATVRYDYTVTADPSESP